MSIGKLKARKEAAIVVSSSSSGSQEVEKASKRNSIDDDSQETKRKLSMKAREDQLELRDKFPEELHEYVEPEVNIVDCHESSLIGQFYAKRSVFITGASGFVGKCLLEKLLRSCPNIREIFILMRPKKGREVGERVEAILRSELFDRLRKLPYGMKQFDKVKPIKGDITKPLFGVSGENLQLLAERVSILLHSAATVKFEEALKVAVENNVVSVANLIEISSRLPKLESLVHVSTAYSNCNRLEVDEIFYETPIEASRLIELAHWMEPQLLDRIAPQLLADASRPNTYTYTKAVAESLILQQAAKLLPEVPIAVVRPSIVAGIWRQPIRGWVDNYNGPTGVMLAMMSGALQAVHVFGDYCADIVPVDMVANLIISSAWQVHNSNSNQSTSKFNITPPPQPAHGVGSVTLKQQQQQQHPQQELQHTGSSSSSSLIKMTKDAHVNESITTATTTTTTTTTTQAPKLGSQQQQRKQQLTVFNCVSGSLNPLAWKDFSRHIIAMARRYPINDAIRPPGTLLISNEFLFELYSLVSHSAFAQLGDLILKCLGQKAKLVALHQRLMRMIKTLRPFTVNQWIFNCSNTTSLYECMAPIDREIFNFDTRQIMWSDYLPRYYIGSKMFVLKDNPSKLLATKARLRAISVCTKLVQILIIILAYRYLILGGPLETLTLETIQASYDQLLSQYAEPFQFNFDFNFNFNSPPNQLANSIGNS